VCVCGQIEAAEGEVANAGTEFGRLGAQAHLEEIQKRVTVVCVNARTHAPPHSCIHMCVLPTLLVELAWVFVCSEVVCPYQCV